MLRLNLAQQLCEAHSIPDGLPPLLASLSTIGSADHGTLVVFPAPNTPASVYSIGAGSQRAMRDSDALAGWLSARREVYLLPTENTAFIPEPLRELTTAGYARHLIVPMLVDGRALAVALFAVRDSSDWRRPQLEAVRDLRSLWIMWLERILFRGRLSSLEVGLGRQLDYMREVARTERGLRELTGQSDAMKTVRRAIQQVAATDSTVLILGETGTGKELVARAIHQASARHRRLLVSVNCASLAPSLLTSELFGHEAGAFTGATKRRIGRFEYADQGTLFLDEISEIPMEHQPALLRTLQEKTIERVGSNTPQKVDVRLIAATHPQIESAVAAGEFRVDLYFRLNVFPIRIPALRDRAEDIPDLANHFAMHFARQMNKPITRIAEESLEILAHHSWPGNVRELENCIERAVIVAEGEVLTVDPAWFAARSSDSPLPKGETWQERERQTILDTLQHTGGRIYGSNGAAARLGLKPTTLYGKMRKLGIRTPRNGYLA